MSSFPKPNFTYIVCKKQNKNVTLVEGAFTRGLKLDPLMLAAGHSLKRNIRSSTLDVVRLSKGPKNVMNRQFLVVRSTLCVLQETVLLIRMAGVSLPRTEIMMAGVVTVPRSGKVPGGMAGCVTGPTSMVAG